MGNFFNSKKLGGKNFDFSNFLEKGAEFWHSVYAVLRTSGGCTEWLKKIRGFL